MPETRRSSHHGIRTHPAQAPELMAAMGRAAGPQAVMVEMAQRAATVHRAPAATPMRMVETPPAAMLPVVKLSVETVAKLPATPPAVIPTVARSLAAALKAATLLVETRRQAV